MIVCKFGGSSLADAAQIKKVKKILDDGPDRKLVVVSAPGKRNSDDIKITDMLYTCEREASGGKSVDEVFSVIEERFLGICDDLDLDRGILEDDLAEIKKNIEAGSGPDYAASRGEFLSAKLLSSFFNMEFIDAADVVFLTSDGRVDEKSYDVLAERISGNGRYIIPGFYGSDPDGKIKTFSRGGSDITGAVVSRAGKADMYENWTDVSGLLMADPRVFSNPPSVPEITYREIRELASLGANVFHEEAIAPVKDIGISINIRNTNDPGAEGTIISPSRDSSSVPVAGISGKSPYIPVGVEKLMLNRHPFFHSCMVAKLIKAGMDPEYIFYGNDSIVYFIKKDKAGDPEKIKDVLYDTASAFPGHCEEVPDNVVFYPAAGVIGVVGEGLDGRIGIGSRVFGSLEKKGINVRYASFGGSPVSLVMGVDEEVFDDALDAVYSSLT